MTFLFNRRKIQHIDLLSLFLGVSPKLAIFILILRIRHYLLLYFVQYVLRDGQIDLGKIELFAGSGGRRVAGRSNRLELEQVLFWLVRDFYFTFRVVYDARHYFELLLDFLIPFNVNLNIIFYLLFYIFILIFDFLLEFIIIIIFKNKL